MAQGVILAGDLNIFRSTIVDGRFMSYLVNHVIDKKIARIAQGKSVVHIQAKELKKIVINFPNQKEQLKIVNLLELIDLKIKKQELLIQNLKSYKRGLFVRLFSTYYKKKISFFEIYEKASEGGTPSTSNQKYYTNGTIPFAKIEDLSSHYLTSTNSYITKDGLNNSSAWIIPTGSIIFSNGATIGACTINKIPVSTKQGILGIVLKDAYSSEYLYHYFTSDDFMHRIKSITTKGTMDCAYLKDINTIKFDVPDTSDQKEIALIMNKLDAVIDKNIDLLLKIQYLKKGMLQRLFI